MRTTKSTAPSMGGVLAGERHPSEKEDRRRPAPSSHEASGLQYANEKADMCVDSAAEE